MNLTGIGVSPGVAQGRVVLVHHDDVELPIAEPREDRPKQVQQLIAATLEAVAQGLEQRAEHLQEPESSEVLKATAMIARDPAITEEVGRQLASGKGRLRALAGAIDHFSIMLSNLGGYMAERVADLRDVHRRAHARLLGNAEPGVPELTEPAIIVAADLAPADTAGLDPKLVLGIVTEQGGPTSHTAILAAQLGIPAVVRCEGILDVEATTLAVDGTFGEVAVNPDAEDRAEWGARDEHRSELQEAVGGPGRTKDGKPIELLANIGAVADAHRAGEADVEGSGLFRSEFLYLGRQTEPSLEEQTETYRQVFQSFAGRKIVVRTLDAGADKPLAFAQMGPEPNPALGMRGLRLYRALPELIETQLQAIAAAAKDCEADVWVMAPMISTPLEASWFADVAHEAGIEKVGTMVEVPGAALRAGQLLEDCDFVSVGTNDLSQYLFAADRLEGRLAELLDAWQPALWQLVLTTAQAGKTADKHVGMCGEACGDPLLALLAVGAGISSLSMALGKVPLVRASLALHTVEQCEEMLEAALATRCPAEARQAVRKLADPAVKPFV